MMGVEKKDRRLTLADALDATRWDYQPGADSEMLLRPVGIVFANLPWEIRPQYLGPGPVAEPDAEGGTDGGTDNGVETQPLEPLKK